MKTRAQAGFFVAFLAGVAVTAAAVTAWWMIESRTVADQAATPAMAMDDMAGMPGMGGMGGMSGGSDASASRSDHAAVMLSPARRQAIGVTTGLVARRPVATTVRALGTVAYDERRVRQVHLRTSGWVTGLAVDYTGRPVRAGEPLLTIYSPELASAQAEYRLARRMQTRLGSMARPDQPGLIESIRTSADAQVGASRERLKLLSLDRTAVAALDRGEPSAEVTLTAPLAGVVTQKFAREGMYVTPETPLYEIADLSVVWVLANVHEQDLPLIAPGQHARVRLAAYPDDEFTGQVVFVEPSVAMETRTVKVRMEFVNHDDLLKPGMSGDVLVDVAGGEVLAVPRDAVLDSGTRTLAFLDAGDGRFEPRDIKTGRTFDGYTEVIDGLQMGDKVVTSGTFLIDSESRLMAATSMMGALGMGGVKMEQAQMGEMDMGGMSGMEGMAGMEGNDMKGMPGMSMRAAETPSTQTIDGVTLTLETDPTPAAKGENAVRVAIRANNAPVTDATVTVAYTMAMPGMEIETVEASHTKDGVYEAQVDLAMRGAWTIDVTATRSSAKPITAHFTVHARK